MSKTPEITLNRRAIETVQLIISTRMKNAALAVYDSATSSSISENEKEEMAGDVGKIIEDHSSIVADFMRLREN